MKVKNQNLQLFRASEMKQKADRETERTCNFVQILNKVSP